ncbi:hypothetical protein [Sphingomonas psychrotolerans]|uniref:hypothetical protein n=1 Tax=Sphingomonas psychrotolerans TaxID=1327635 RepID=UPI001F4567F3|nr:hypothetical protein [Sphingomonas psychrotolerans]
MPISSLPKFSAVILLLCGSAAGAESTASGTFNLRLTVPVICAVSHQSAISAAGAGYRLGELREYCNAPGGYALVVNYAPGSMKGAVVAVGEERVVLDGSGRAVIGRTAGPRIRDREIFAEPGAAGFDTDRLEFNLEA